MSRFIQCGCGRLVNVDSIARVEAGYKKHDDCTIITKDGEYLTAPSNYSFPFLRFKVLEV